MANPNTLTRMRVTEIGFHEGNALAACSDTYQDVSDAILEQIQNAIDAGAQRIELRICVKNRNYSIMDDGEGRTVSDFNLSLKSIFKSSKDSDKLGRFGRGLMSSVNKCELMTFTSIGKLEGKKYHRWYFERSKIIDQEKVGIPIETLPSVYFDPSRSGKDVRFKWWRTEIAVQNYTKDKRIGQIDFSDLNERSLDRFSEKISKNNIALNLIEVDSDDNVLTKLKVSVKNFSGKRVTEWISKDLVQDCGVVRVQLFLSKKGKEGRVLIGDETGSRVPLKDASRSKSLVKSITDEVCQALLSGYFEGELLCEKINLHPDRKGFIENDALLGFGLCIKDWWDKQGKDLYHQLKNTKQQDRYQKLGIEALQNFEKILDSNNLIKEALKLIGSSTIGIGNASPSRGTTDTAIGSKGSPFIPRLGEKEPGDPRTKSKTPNSAPVNSVSGPSGTERRIAKSRYGIHVTYSFATTFKQLWRFEVKTGELEVNTSHPLWKTCAESNWKNRALQEDCIRQAVSTLLYDKETSGRMATDVQEVLASMFVGSMQIGSLKPGRPSTDL